VFLLALTAVHHMIGMVNTLLTEPGKPTTKAMMFSIGNVLLLTLMVVPWTILNVATTPSTSLTSGTMLPLTTKATQTYGLNSSMSHINENLLNLTIQIAKNPLPAQPLCVLQALVSVIILRKPTTIGPSGVV